MKFSKVLIIILIPFISLVYSQDNKGTIRGPEIAEFIARAESGQPLSNVDQRRLRARTERTFLAWQWEFGQYVDGNLAEGELPIESYRRTLSGERDISGSREIWDAFKFNLRPDFVEWMEKNVLGE